MNILVVDDMMIDTVIIRKFLKKAGYGQLYTANSAVEAMDLLNQLSEGENTPVDLILMDVNMPGISGIEACRQIKLTRQLKDIPIIIFTAKPDVDMFKLALSAGALDFLHKPIKESELLARVHSALQLKAEIETRKEREYDLIEANRLLDLEKQKSEKLIENILPETIATELKQKGSTTPELYENVSVFLSDIVGFTMLASMLDPESLISELNDMFTAFDDIMEKNGCERIKTIGDAYLAVCGMPEPNADHAASIVRAGLEIIDYLNRRNENTLIKWKVRIGIDSGKVVGGVVGVKKYIYDIFGDTVNTASRMETHSDPMRINVSQNTCEIIKDSFVCIERAPVMIKGKGKMRMFFIERALADDVSPTDTFSNEIKVI